MKHKDRLESISDDELLNRLAGLLKQSRRLESELVAHIAEVDERKGKTPISPNRHKIEFTASAELLDKLERLRTLMRSSVPDGDLSAIIEEVLNEKL